MREGEAAGSTTTSRKDMTLQADETSRQNRNSSPASVQDTVSHYRSFSTQTAPHDDAQEQVQALLRALDLLAKLASMDTENYQSTLTGKPSSAQEEQQDAANDSSRLQQALDQIQSKWKLEETSIPLLTRSIHRFHSNLTILQAESDQHAQEIRTLQQQVSELCLQKKKFEKAVTKLNTKNAKLTEKLKQKYKERKSLVKHVKDYVQKVQDSKVQQQELEEITTAYKLQAHEQFLLQNRVRTTSVDSNFSDADALDFPDSDNVSLHSSCSVSSFVTDEGVATVRFTPAGNSHDSPLSDQSEDSSSESYHSPTLAHPATTTKPPVYTLSFPRGTKVGLRVRSISVDELPKPPKGILTSADLEGDDSKTAAHAKTESESRKPKDETKRDGFSMGFHFDSLLGKPPAHSHSESDVKSTSSQRGQSFVVSGFNEDFDTQLNGKPTLGARIVAINEESIDSSWSMSHLMERLHANCDAENDGGSYTVSFRNDPLTRKQRESLGKPPIHQTVHSERTEMTTDDISESSKTAGGQGGQHSFNFGFLKIGHGNHTPTGRHGQLAVSCDSSTPAIPHPDELDPNNSEESVEKTEPEVLEPRSGSTSSNVFQFWKSGDAGNAQSPGRKPKADSTKQEHGKETKGGGGPGFQIPFWKPQSQPSGNLDEDGSPRSTAEAPSADAATLKGIETDVCFQENEKKLSDERFGVSDKDGNSKWCDDAAEGDSLAAEVLQETAPSQGTDLTELPEDEENNSDCKKNDDQSAEGDTTQVAENVPARPVDGGDIARNAKKAVSKFFSNPFHN